MTETGNPVSGFSVFCLLLERLLILKASEALRYSVLSFCCCVFDSIFMQMWKHLVVYHPYGLKCFNFTR